ncbi:MAG: hypothetical protein EA359_14790 [Balneolaceae bacterium]|nr:MAG: hypothetical protein EA359_14790 [Balneolaceae bacterium]
MFIILLIVAVALFILPELALSQAPPPPPSKPAQAPIDGGLGILAAAGGAYAIKKLRDRKTEWRNPV